MNKPTPGPWRVCGGYTQKYTTIASEDGYIVFAMADKTFHKEQDKLIKAPDMETQRANATLIAASPDLLNACECALETLQNLTSEDFARGADKGCRAILGAAIAKAEANIKCIKCGKPIIKELPKDEDERCTECSEAWSEK